MNKKFFAYTTAAILIGFAVMMLPLALETAYPKFPMSETSRQAYTGEGQDQIRAMYGLGSQPSVTSSSFILLVGLIIAFTAYILVKRQLNQQPTTFSP